VEILLEPLMDDGCFFDGTGKDYANRECSFALVKVR
jgi:hypothetical protein